MTPRYFLRLAMIAFTLACGLALLALLSSRDVPFCDRAAAIEAKSFCP